MRRIIDIDENLFVRLYDNGVELSKEDSKNLEIVVRNSEEIKARPIGKWIEHFNKAQNDYDIECSECSVWQDWRLVRRSFCPHCGARIKGAEK